VTYPATRCRLVSVVAWRGEYIALWDGCAVGGLHRAVHDVGPAESAAGPPSLDAAGARGWEGACERCGGVVPWEATKPCSDGCGELVPAVTLSSSVRHVWDTPSGRLEPGCMYYASWYDCRARGHCYRGWTNCDGRHLYVVLPNGHEWDIDSRASNCNRPDDTEHRCWVRGGEPPNVTAGKDGNTCSAGAGSIASGDYHGFLRDGVLTAG
jgi:hypothetical protein